MHVARQILRCGVADYGFSAADGGCGFCAPSYGGIISSMLFSEAFEFCLRRRHKHCPHILDTFYADLAYAQSNISPWTVETMTRREGKSQLLPGTQQCSSFYWHLVTSFLRAARRLCISESAIAIQHCENAPYPLGLSDETDSTGKYIPCRTRLVRFMQFH
jgi:hypothetical protein